MGTIELLKSKSLLALLLKLERTEAVHIALMIMIISIRFWFVIPWVACIASKCGCKYLSGLSRSSRTVNTRLASWVERFPIDGRSNRCRHTQSFLGCNGRRRLCAASRSCNSCERQKKMASFGREGLTRRLTLINKQWLAQVQPIKNRYSDKNERRPHRARLHYTSPQQLVITLLIGLTHLLKLLYGQLCTILL